jgi:hypothetical protein
MVQFWWLIDKKGVGGIYVFWIDEDSLFVCFANELHSLDSNFGIIDILD